MVFFANRRRQEVLDFVKFLPIKIQKEGLLEKEEKSAKNKSDLGKRLREIRAEIIASGTPLLTDEEVEREKAERRGGYQGDE